MEPREFHLRIDRKALKDLTDLQEWVQQNCEEYMISYETPVKNPDNPHYQGWIRTLKKDSALRKSLGKILLLKGNAAYSISKCREKENLLQYTCKDGNVVLTTFPLEQVEVYIRIGKETKEEVAKKITKKPKPPTNQDRMFKELDCSKHSKELFKDVVRWYVANGKTLTPDGCLKLTVKTLRLRFHLAAGNQIADDFLKAWADRLYDIGPYGEPEPDNF